MCAREWVFFRGMQTPPEFAIAPPAAGGSFFLFSPRGPAAARRGGGSVVVAVAVFKWCEGAMGVQPRLQCFTMSLNAVCVRV